MFDIGWQELFIVGVLAIIVIGPKDLPAAMRTIASVVRKARGLAREFQSGFDDMVREAGIDDIKEQVDKAGDFDIGQQLEDSFDPTGEFADDFNFSDIESDLDDSVREKPAIGAPDTEEITDASEILNDAGADDLGDAAKPEPEPESVSESETAADPKVTPKEANG